MSATCASAVVAKSSATALPSRIERFIESSSYGRFPTD
jgi:hypothetical protein